MIMSGGYWNYRNDTLASELFGYNLDAHYGEQGFEQANQARDINPLEDKEVSEILWDMMCVLNSYDYYKSGDIGEDTYKKDLLYFKKKWFKRTRKDALDAYKNDLKNYAEKLINEFSFEEK